MTRKSADTDIGSSTVGGTDGSGETTAGSIDRLKREGSRPKHVFIIVCGAVDYVRNKNEYTNQ